jgi:O-antigen ligase
VAVLTFLVLVSTAKTWRRPRTWLFIGGGLLFIGGGLALAFSHPLVRLNLLHQRDVRDQLVITSNDAHLTATAAGLQQIIDQPFGCGAGCAGTASFYNDQVLISENYYLQIGQEYGLAGLILWLIIMYYIVSTLWRNRRDGMTAVWLSALAGYLIIGLFLHVFNDEPLVILWFMIAGVLYGQAEQKTA